MATHYNTYQFIDAISKHRLWEQNHEEGQPADFRDAIITYKVEDLPPNHQNDSATIIGINFDGASFIDCHLHNLSFANCSMLNTDFSRSKLTECDFINCDMTRDKTHNFQFSKYGGFSRTTLSNVHFYDVTFTSTNFIECITSDCYFSGCHFNDSKLSHFDVNGGIFYNNTFTDTLFANFNTTKHTRFDSCKFNSTPLYESVFYNCFFKDSYIKDSRIMNCSFANSDLRLLRFNSNNNEIIDVNFENAFFKASDLPYLHRGYLNIGKDNFALTISYAMNKTTGRISCEDFFGVGTTVSFNDFRKKIQSGAIIETCMNKFFFNIKKHSYNDIRIRISIKNSLNKNYDRLVNDLKEYRSNSSVK